MSCGIGFETIIFDESLRIPLWINTYLSCSDCLCSDQMRVDFRHLGRAGGIRDQRAGYEPLLHFNVS